MALFNDGEISTADDLRAYESTILDVASAEGVELDRKLDVARREIGTQLTEFLLHAGTEATQARKLSTVMVTEALRQWHSLQTLSAIFRDAFNSQLNDRYAGKWKEYARLAQDAKARLFEVGVGMCSDPVPAADLPACGTTNGGVLPAHTYSVQVCWESRWGRKGGLSEPVVVNADAGQLVTVATPDAPADVAGWHVYAGEAGSGVTRQNTGLLAIGSTWTMPVDGLVAGVPPDDDPGPDSYVVRNRGFRG